MYVIRKVRALSPTFESRGPAVPLLTPPAHPTLLPQRIKLAPEQAIFLFVSSGTLPPSVATLQSVYDQHRDEDGFLYMTYSGENFFGAC